MKLPKHSLSCAMTGMGKSNNTVCDVEVGKQTRDISGERKYGRGRTTGRTDSAINVQCEFVRRLTLVVGSSCTNRADTVFLRSGVVLPRTQSSCCLRARGLLASGALHFAARLPRH